MTQHAHEQAFLALDSEVTTSSAFGIPTVDVPVVRWRDALSLARDKLGLDYFDWLSAVDELDDGFTIVVHLWSMTARSHLLLRTTVSRSSPRLPSAVEVFRGAAWHERETYEMFGIEFDGHPNLIPLLLPDGFEGHPLRKEFVLAARAAKAWPGAKEPGESEHGAPSRRTLQPPGVPDVTSWGPRPFGTAAAAPPQELSERRSARGERGSDRKARPRPGEGDAS
jgi:NADH-quinone oxidoreductase subunit C